MNQIVGIAQGGSILPKNAQLARRFFDDHESLFAEARRKRTASRREFILPKSRFRQWCVDIGMVPGLPNDPALTNQERHGRQMVISGLMRDITRAATNPDFSTDQYPNFRVTSGGRRSTFFVIQLAEAYSPYLVVEPVQHVGRYIQRRAQDVRRVGRWARQHPEMPNSAHIAHAASISDGLLEDLTIFLRSAARRLSALPAPTSVPTP